MSKKAKLSVTGYEVKQSSFIENGRLKLDLMVKGISSHELAEHLHAILNAVQGLEVELGNDSIVKSESDTSYFSKGVTQKDIELNLNNITADSIGYRDIKGITLNPNPREQHVFFKDKKIATISDEGIDVHVPVTIDGKKVAEVVATAMGSAAESLENIRKHEMRLRGGI